jgi:hypothetical protein
MYFIYVAFLLLVPPNFWGVSEVEMKLTNTCNFHIHEITKEKRFKNEFMALSLGLD